MAPGRGPSGVHHVAPVRVGLFFMKKSDRVSSRLIIGARPTNEMSPPPKGSRYGPPKDLSASRRRWATWARRRGRPTTADRRHLGCARSLPRLAAHAVGLSGSSLEGCVLRPTDLVLPCCKSLCMGFSWSVYYAKKANDCLMSRCLRGRSFGLVKDRGTPAVATSASTRQPGGLRQ